MGKEATSLTNSLYKINDRIAQATNKAPVTETPQQAAEQLKTEQNQQTVPQKSQLSPERILEFNRMYHDLEIRLESLFSEYQGETNVLDQRKMDLTESCELVKKLKEDLSGIMLPEESEPDPAKKLSKSLRAIELMRLESIRLEKKMDSSKIVSQQSFSGQKYGMEPTELPNSELMKKGFAFFLPLGLFLLLCTVLLSLAFIFAWKVAL